MLRIFYLTITLIILSQLVRAQTNTDFNTNLGIKIFSYGQLPSLLNQDIKKSERKYLSGIILKFNDNQLAYRLSFDWFSKSNYHFAGSDSTRAVGKYTDYALKLGFERDLSVSKMKPSFGMDLGFFHSDFSGTQSFGNTGLSKNLSTLKNGVSLNPFVGLKYTFIPRFYVSIEAGLSFVYSYNRIETSGALGGLSGVSHYTKGEFLTIPVSFVGLHYNFGSAN